MNKELGSAQYFALQVFDTVHLAGYGENSSSGWRNYFEQSPHKIYPPIHIFYSEPPSGISLPVITPFVATTSFSAGEEIPSISIVDAKGQQEIDVIQVSPVKLDLQRVMESSALGAIHVHGTQEEIRKVFGSSAGDLARPGLTYFEKSLGRWVDPLTPPKITAECVKWCRITPWDKWCCGHAYKVEVMRVEAVLVVQIAEPADIQQQIEIAIRDATVAGAFAALTAALASGGIGAGKAFVATFAAAFQAKLASLITERILMVDVVFRTAWGRL